MVSLNTDKNFLYFCVFFFYIMDIVCSDKRYTSLSRNFNYLRQNPELLSNSVILYFEIIIAATESLVIPKCSFLSSVIIVLQQFSRNFSRKTGRQSNKPLVIFLEELFINTRLCIKSRHPRFRHNFDKIFISRIIFTEQNKMKTLVINTVNFIKARTWSNINFTTDNGLYPILFSCFIKLNGTEHISVVCYG